ncbi:MAG TPA: Sec-independent protein translocase protein TatB [Pyrinomonadaceae bacterium]|nr:Sec-independent protein translocase protein TatB [Pyrinomonadaceae bacterium]
MFLFIFESIGTSELILIGIVALVFLGPRKLPEIARKAGKMMAEFRGTASEFKETWQREVDFEEEAKLLNLNEIEAETVAHDDIESPAGPSDPPDVPAIRSIDPSSFEFPSPADSADAASADANVPILPETTADNDKKNWL